MTRRGRLGRFVLALWTATGVFVYFASWPYALVGVLLATCVYFAATESVPEENR